MIQTKWCCLFVLLDALLTGPILAWLLLHSRWMLGWIPLPTVLPENMSGLDLPSYENLTIPSLDSRSGQMLQLSAWFFHAPGPVKDECIVAVHGHWSSKAVYVNPKSDLHWLISSVLPIPTKFMLERAVVPLSRAGFAVVLLDLRNHGDSDWALPISAGLHEADDVLATISYLKQTGRCRLVGLMGESMGAATVLAAASKAPEGAVTAVLADSSFDTLESMAHPWFQAKVALIPLLVVDHVLEWVFWFSPELRQFKLSDRAQLIQVPLMLVHGRADATIPFETGSKAIWNAVCQEQEDTLPLRRQFEHGKCRHKSVFYTWHDKGHCRAHEIPGYDDLVMGHFFKRAFHEASRL